MIQVLKISGAESKEQQAFQALLSKSLPESPIEPNLTLLMLTASICPEVRIVTDTQDLV